MITELCPYRMYWSQLFYKFTRRFCNFRLVIDIKKKSTLMTLKVVKHLKEYEVFIIMNKYWQLLPKLQMYKKKWRNNYEY